MYSSLVTKSPSQHQPVRRHADQLERGGGGAHLREPPRGAGRQQGHQGRHPHLLASLRALGGGGAARVRLGIDIIISAVHG